MPELDAVASKVLSVSRAAYERRERAYRQAAARNPRKRGPKPKHHPVRGGN